MPVLDLLILGGLALGVWRGMQTGALAQLVGLVGAIVAFWGGIVLMELAGAALVRSLGISERVAPVAGFVVTFAGILGGLTAAAHLARAVLASLRAGFLDRGLGALVGGARAGVVLSVLLLVAGSAALPGGATFPGEATRARSALYEPVHALAPTLWEGLRTVTPTWRDRLERSFRTLVETESDATPRG